MHFAYVGCFLLSSSYFAATCVFGAVLKRQERPNINVVPRVIKDLIWPDGTNLRKILTFHSVLQQERLIFFFPPLVLSLLEKAEIRPSPEKWAGVAIYKHVWSYYKPTEEKFELVWKDLLNSYNVSSQILFTQTRADQGHSKTQPAQTFKARVIFFFNFFILSSLRTE